MKTFDDIITEIDEKIEHPLISPTFGDHWKEYATKQKIPYKNVVSMAWRQGRRAILLERKLKQVIEMYEACRMV